MASALENLVGSPFRVEPYATLMERSLGSAANLTVAEIEDVLRSDPRLGEPPAKWREDSQFRLPLPGAESLLEAGERVARHLAERIVPLAGSERVDTLKILVGHGGSVRHAAVRLGLLTPEQVADLSMHYCAPIYWERLEGGWVHLDGEWKKRTPPPTEGLEDE
jgi:2,3-bisphosphoglycerate-dependent phosphoglycerate mutase